MLVYKAFCKNGTEASLLLSFSLCVLMKERSRAASFIRPTLCSIIAYNFPFSEYE